MNGTIEESIYDRANDLAISSAKHQNFSSREARDDFIKEATIHLVDEFVNFLWEEFKSSYRLRATLD